MVDICVPHIMSTIPSKFLVFIFNHSLKHRDNASGSSTLVPTLFKFLYIFAVAGEYYYGTLHTLSSYLGYHQDRA